MNRDIVLAKSEIIERSLKRVADVYAGAPANLRDDLTKQDSIVLNLQRACEASIDLAMHVVSAQRLGVPQDSRAAFALLVSGGVLPEALGDSLQRMVGFRNVAVHDYRALSLDIVQAIIETRTDDLRAFVAWALAGLGSGGSEPMTPR